MSYEIFANPEKADQLKWHVLKNRSFSGSISIRITLLAPHPSHLESTSDVLAFAATELERLGVTWLFPDGDEWVIDLDRLRADISDTSILPSWAVGRRRDTVSVTPGMFFIEDAANGQIYGTGIDYKERAPANTRFFDGVDMHLHVDKEDAFRKLGEHLQELEDKVTGKPKTVVANLKPDLAFMISDKLRAVVIGDLEDIDRGLSVGSAKPTMISCGSALEGVLLDVLDRRRDIASSYMKRAQDWPERVSLKQLVEIALKNDLLTATAAKLGETITEHRDLIHPLRCASTDIHVDNTTAETMVQLLKVAVRDLAKAARDRKIDAYVNRT